MTAKKNRSRTGAWLLQYQFATSASRLVALRSVRPRRARKRAARARAGEGVVRDDGGSGYGWGDGQLDLLMVVGREEGGWGNWGRTISIAAPRIQTRFCSVTTKGDVRR